MARLPALDILLTMDPAQRAEYDGSLAEAQSFARRLPLVRVVVPDASTDPGNRERLQREARQIEDIFHHGRLKPEHESANAHAVAGRLGVGHSLYFHAGRTHPDYGKLALVFRELPGDDSADATPFGLGGLLCTSNGRWHDTGSCTSPVAHDPEPDQVDFVRESRWTSAWREQAGSFLAAYFGVELHRYFLPEAEGKPKREDPAGIHADPHARDWRSWTIEVRFTREIDLFEVLNRGALQAWAIDTRLATQLQRLEQVRGQSYPWWNELRRSVSRQIVAPGLGTAELFAQVDGEVRDQCLR